MLGGGLGFDEIPNNVCPFKNGLKVDQSNRCLENALYHFFTPNTVCAVSYLALMLQHDL